MKLLLIFSLLFSVSLAHAGFGPMSVKERLRILLWIEGLEESKTSQVKEKKAPQLPEELEKPLRNL